MDRITAKSVRNAFDLLTAEAARHGIDTAAWILEQPDQGYHVMLRTENHGRADIPGFPGLVGLSAREAFETMTNMRRGMEIIRFIKQG